jgi:hypothetical protein
MKMKNNLFGNISLSSGLALALALVVWMPGEVRAGPDLKGSERMPQMRVINTMAQAEALQPGDSFAMVCAKCKSVAIETVTLEKGHIKHLMPGTKHLCPGCNTFITVVRPGHYSISEVTHTCTACGDGSAFCCATTTNAPPTKGMETDK